MRGLGARRAAFVAILASAAALAGCGGPSTSSTSTSTTSTTTTTLPSPVAIAASTPTGPFSFLGPVNRINVVAPMLGSALLPPPPTALGATLPSVRLAYRRFGSGPNLLMVMGEHGTMTWWDPQLLNLLAQHFTVTIFDLPGVGYSAASSGPTTLASDADTTAGLVVALGLDVPSVTLLGWGLGGTIALDAVVRHPHLATGLVLVDSPAPGRLNVAASAHVTADLASTVVTTTGLSHLMFPSDGDAARTQWLDRLGEIAPDDETAAAVQSEAALASSVRGDAALATEAHKLTIPVRVMTGDSDEVVPSANAAHLAATIPHAHLLVLDDAGYAALVSDQARFVAALDAFVP